MSLFHVSDSKPPKRDVRFNMMMSADEKAHLDSLAKQAGLHASELIRVALNDYTARANVSKISKKRS
jgi:hypothetical protein